MTQLSNEELCARMDDVQKQHRDLDRIIHALEASHSPDKLELSRLKKRKLLMKDQIAQIEDLLLPDIIA